MKITAQGASAPERPFAHLDSVQLLREFERTGSSVPFEEIVRRFTPVVYATCLRVTRDAHDAEDATQAAFLTLAAKGRLNGEIHAPEAWLRKVGHRLALDLIRSKKRRNNRENQRSKMTSEVRPIDSSQSADNSETRSILHEELAKLPAGYRMPLILHYFGGLSREEMSDQLRIKPSTLGVRLHRAREQLKKRMARRGINMPMAALTLFLGETVRQRITDSIVAQTTSSIASIGTSHGLGFATVGSSIGSMQSSIISSNLIASSIRDVLASVATSKLKVGVVAFVAALSFGMNSPSIARLIPESIVQQIKRIKLSDFFNDFNPNLKPAQLKSPAPVLTSQTEQITPTLREFNNTFARADNSFQPYIPATSFNPVPIVTDLKPITIASIGARSVDDIAPTFTTSVPTARRIDTAPRTITNTPITTNSSFTSISSGPKAFRASSNSNVNRATTSNDIVRSNSSNSSSSDKSFRIGETTSNGRRASDGKNVSGAIISTPDFSDSSDTTSNGTRASSTGSKPNSGASIPPKPPKVTIDPPKQTTQNNSVAIPQSVDSILSTPSYLSSSSSSSSSSSNSNSNSNDYWTTNSSTNAPTGSSTPTAEINQFTISSVAVTDELHATHVARPGAFDLLLGDVESASFTETVRFSGTPDAFGGYNFATMSEDQLSEAASVLQSRGSVSVASLAPVNPFDTLGAANSVKITLHDETKAGGSSIDFVETSDVTTLGLPALPIEHTFFGLWKLDSAGEFEEADIEVRYDDVLASRLGLNEHWVKLWITDGTSWDLLVNDPSFGRDTNRNLVWASAENVKYFAVSTPEPATLGVIVCAMVIALRRRR